MHRHNQRRVIFQVPENGSMLVRATDIRFNNKKPAFTGVVEATAGLFAILGESGQRRHGRRHDMGETAELTSPFFAWRSREIVYVGAATQHRVLRKKQA